MVSQFENFIVSLLYIDKEVFVLGHFWKYILYMVSHFENFTVSLLYIDKEVFVQGHFWKYIF